MTTKNYILLFLLSLSLKTTAQYNAVQQTKWAIGNTSGLDFSNAGDPVLFATAMTNGEGEASICDANGDLLFYTNGSTVWNKNGIVMPNGMNLTGTGTSATTSTTQGTLIVPMPDSAHKYYLFSLTAVSNCKLFCNVIDMNLDNGLGNVDVSFPLRLTAIRQNLTEKMTAVPGNNNDVWLMVHREMSDSFLAYHITPTGLDLNYVSSQIGIYPAVNYQQGVMKFSPDRTKLLTCNFRATNPASAGLEVFTFDPATGLLSNAINLDNNSYYGGTFSPDNTKVYAQTTNTLNQGTVVQFDLSAATPSTTKTSLGPSGQYTDMKLGPDGKIYFGALAGSPGWSNYKWLGRINSPNNAGTLCDFQDSVTSLYFPHPTNASMGKIQQGMPNDIAIPVANPLSLTKLDFNAKPINNDVYVTWNAEGQEKITDYTLEKSFDGRSYSAIYITGVKRNSGYSFTDIKALEDHNHIYYRLRIREQNNKISYSAVAHVSGKKLSNGTLVIYPNPVRDIVYIFTAEPVDVTIFDMTGRILIKEKNVKQINVSELPDGIYQLSASCNKGIQQSKIRFIKSAQ